MRFINFLILFFFLISMLACTSETTKKQDATSKDTESQVEELLSRIEQPNEENEPKNEENDLEVSIKKIDAEEVVKSQVDIKDYVKAEVLNQKRDALRELMMQSHFFNTIPCCKEAAKKECCCQQLFNDFLVIEKVSEKARIKKEDPIFNQICREQLDWFSNKIDSLDKAALAADDDW